MWFRYKSVQDLTELGLLLSFSAWPWFYPFLTTCWAPIIKMHCHVLRILISFHEHYSIDIVSLVLIFPSIVSHYLKHMAIIFTDNNQRRQNLKFSFRYLRTWKCVLTSKMISRPIDFSEWLKNQTGYIRDQVLEANFQNSVLQRAIHLY